MKSLACCKLLAHVKQNHTALAAKPTLTSISYKKQKPISKESSSQKETETQTKTTIRHYFIPSKMAMMKKE